MLQSWVIFPGLDDSFPWGISYESPAWVLVLLQWSRSYSSCAFCIFRFFIFLLWMWKVIRERRIRQQMRVTKTIKTKVDEKDWKNCPICVMQVLLALEEPEVQFKRQGGRERLDPLDSSALIEEARLCLVSFPLKDGCRSLHRDACHLMLGRGCLAQPFTPPSFFFAREKKDKNK